MNEKSTAKVKKPSIFARISSYLGASVKNGLFGFLMTSYNGGMAEAKTKGFIYKKVITPIKVYISRAIDTSVMMNVFDSAKRYLLACRLRVYGTFFFSFGLYSALIVLFRHFIISDGTEIESAVFPALVSLASIPLISSGSTLAKELCSSKLGRNIRDYTGFRRESIETDKAVGRSNIAFALGLLFGMLTIVFTPARILACLAIAVYGMAVLSAPEVGVVSLFFLVPWMKTVKLAWLLLFITFSLLIKVIRGKRTLHFERVDFTVFVFGVLVILGGLIPGGNDVFSSALLYSVFLLGYFVAVSTLRSKKWFSRAVYSAVASAALIAVYTAVGYAIPLVSDVAFIDYPALVSFFNAADNVFGDAKMLTDYFVLVFPLAVGSYMSAGMKAGRRFACFFVSLLIIACTVLDFSVGAVITLIVSFAIILAVRNHNFVYLFLAALCAVPVLAVIFPDTVSEIFRFIVPDKAYASIEDMLRVWYGTSRMIKDYFIGGIGLGNGAWQEVYSRYAIGTVSDAPHSYSLYLQILSTLGVFGLASFTVLILSVFRSSFTCLLRKSAYSELLMEPENEQGKRIIKRDYISSKTETASAVAAVASALIAGTTDFIWYNYRLFFMFWLVVALAVGNSRSDSCDTGYALSGGEKNGKAEAELTIRLM